MQTEVDKFHEGVGEAKVRHLSARSRQPPKSAALLTKKFAPLRTGQVTGQSKLFHISQVIRFFENVDRKESIAAHQDLMGALCSYSRYAMSDLNAAGRDPVSPLPKKNR
jgi:hypothetical protein